MFKKLISLSLLFSVSLFAIDFDLKPKKLSDDLYCFFGKLEAPSEENAGYMSNSCYIKGNNSYILVDSGSSYEFAKQAYESMSKIAKLPVEAIIITHEHDDHWLGNSYYKEKFNAKIIGPSLINEMHKPGSKSRIMNLLSAESMHGTKIVSVDQEIKETTTLNLSGKEITIVPINYKAHTPDDLIVYMNKEKILFGGDIIMNGRINSTRDGSVVGMVKAVELIKSKDWNILVPGHGFEYGLKAIDETEKYYSLLKQRVMDAVEEDVGSSDVSNLVTMEEFRHMPFYEIFNKRNVFDAYTELEFYDGE